MYGVIFMVVAAVSTRVGPYYFQRTSTQLVNPVTKFVF